MAGSGAEAGAPLWGAEEAAAATGGRLAGAAGWAAQAVSIDSREIDAEAGAPPLFVALEGLARDGHAFVADALARGAAAALVSRRPDGLDPAAPLLLVDDTLRALERLAAAARARPGPEFRAIAVTGSVGKTSTKDMLARMLAGAGPTHAAVKSFNNHWGAPLTLARTPRAARFGVYELGMSAAGEIAPLSRLARPDVALITTVEAVHLEAFDSVEGIADAKAEIFEGLAPGGAAALNADNPHFARLAAHARARGAEILRFGAAAGVEARLLGATLEADRTLVSAEIFGRPLAFEIGAPGAHFARNALGALLCVARAGADPAAAAARLAGWGAVGGRGARAPLALPGGGAALLIDESYNANPASMRAALETFAAADPPAPGGRRVAFLTDMLELGAAGPAMHAALAEAPGMAAVDLVCLAGPLTRSLRDALDPARRGPWFEDAEALAEAAPGVLQAGDLVMVKGSNGSRAGLIARRLRALAAGAPETPPG